MAVRAKFLCQEKRHYNDDPNNPANVTFMAVYSADPTSENYTYWQYTPAGQVTMQGLKPEAARHFEQGKQYYLDFTPAD